MSRSFEYSRSKTITTIVIVGILIGLGCWQLERREWKTALLDTIATRQAAKPVTKIQLNTTSADYMALDYRRAELTGLVDDSKVIYLGPRTFNNMSGYHQLTPMFLQDGKVILLNEGFVPYDWVNTAHPTSAHVQTLSGTLRLPALPGRFTPTNPPDGNKFYWPDLLAIGTRLGTPHLLPLIFELDRTGDSFPVGGQTNLMLPNDHLNYALTWFALAIGMIGVYLVSSFRSHTGIVSMYGMDQLNQRPSFDNSNLYGRNRHDDPDKQSDQPPSIW